MHINDSLYFLLMLKEYLLIKDWYKSQTIKTYELLYPKNNSILGYIYFNFSIL